MAGRSRTTWRGVRRRAVEAATDRRFFAFNAAVSLAALGLLAWLLLIHGGVRGPHVDLHFMPAVNATLNGLTSVLMICGYAAVKRGQPQVHRYFMVAATATSAAFLVGYLVYHSVHGDTKFGGTGALRAFYFFVLASHVLLSMAVVPLLLTALWFAGTRRFASHKKVTRKLFPIWLYVSVTGVLIFFLLRGAPTQS